MERITVIFHLNNRDTIVDSVICESEEKIASTYKAISELEKMVQNMFSGIFIFGHTTVRVSEIAAYRVYQKEVR